MQKRKLSTSWSVMKKQEIICLINAQASGASLNGVTHTYRSLNVIIHYIILYCIILYSKHTYRAPLYNGDSKQKLFSLFIFSSVSLVS